MGGFTRKNYDKKFSVDFTAENDGHGFKVSFPEKQYNVSGGKLSGTYTTVQFHIHWGADNSKGSEHTVNGKQYAAEVFIYLLFCLGSKVKSLEAGRWPDQLSPEPLVMGISQEA